MKFTNPRTPAGLTLEIVAAFERRPGRARVKVSEGPASETRHTCDIGAKTMTRSQTKRKPDHDR